jgi:hypothetical protein
MTTPTSKGIKAMHHVQHPALTTGLDSAPSHGPRRSSAVKLVCAGALSVAALLVAGCGSASTAPSASGDSVAAVSVPTSGETTHGLARGAARPASLGKVRHTRVNERHAPPKQPKANERHAPPKQPKANERYAPPKITKGNPVQRPIAGTGGSTANDDNPAGKASRADSGGRPTTRGVPNPCALVTVAQAHALTGKAVAVSEAPLGPTCIYRESGAKAATVTVAVQRLQFSALKPHIQKLSELTIAGRSAYCGVYGTAVTYVLLPGHRALSISAPCAVGTKFAATALSKLGY